MQYGRRGLPWLASGTVGLSYEHGLGNPMAVAEGARGLAAVFVGLEMEMVGCQTAVLGLSDAQMVGSRTSHEMVLVYGS